MTAPLKAIVIGAYPRFVQKIEKKLKAFLDFKLIMTDERVKPEVMPEAKVIVILTDYVGRENASAGWDLGRARKIPVVECRSENYVRDELERLELIGKEQEKEADKQNETTVHPQETSVGLTHEQILQYVPEAKKLIKELLTPGDEVDESILLSLLEEGIGLPADVIKSVLLPEIAVTGLIQNTVGTTWKRTGGGQSEEEVYRYVEEPKPRRPTRRDYYVSKIAGLPSGPYKSLYAVSRELAKYTEFLLEDGSAPSASYRFLIVKHAANRGLIEERNGRYFVLHDASVKLTPLPVAEAAKEEPDSAPRASSIPTTYTPIEHLKGIEKDPPEAESSRAMIGDIDVNSVPIQLKTLKNLMPQRHWDEMAFRAISKRMASMKVDGRPPGKDRFEPEEWDALAWEQLQKLPLAMVVPTWMPDTFKDERLICSVPRCQDSFVFTKSEQEHFYRMFGEVKRPKLCPRCRRLRKEGKLDGGDDPDRILNRYGGQ